MIYFYFLVIWYTAYPGWENLQVRQFNTVQEACDFAADLKSKEDRLPSNPAIFETVSQGGWDWKEVKCVIFPDPTWSVRKK